MRGVHAKIEVLSATEIEQIHAATLEVLGTVGCHLPHRRVLERLTAEGAPVDFAKGQAKLPPALVEKALCVAAGDRRIPPDDHFREAVLRGGHLGIGPGNQTNILALDDL
jgi:trimethylamine:corrinoid methyltransferase-like protein